MLGTRLREEIEETDQKRFFQAGLCIFLCAWAVRLAAAGHSVLVIEAGELATGLAYDVPVFHGFASESPDMAWNFFVSHYDNEIQARRDDKYDPARGGVLYPQATESSLENALVEFESVEPRVIPEELQRWAARFSESNFRQGMERVLKQ